MPKESHPSLAEVQSAFEAWRKHRPTRSTPPALRAQAVGLLAHHRISEVMNALHVDHRRLSRWRRELSASAHPVPVTDFIELPAGRLDETKISAPPLAELTLTRQTPDGSAISIHGQLSDAQWRWALGLLTEQGS